jgi:DNA-binding NtrC family response regulator
VSEIDGLVRQFIRHSRKMLGRKEETELTPEAMALLKQYAWPGNVRELKNVIERAVLLARDGRITLDELPVDKMRDTFTRRASQLDLSAHVPVRAPKRDEHDTDTREVKLPETTGDDPERTRILAALDKFAGNQTRAAQFLGISRRTLINRIETYGISRPRK